MACLPLLLAAALAAASPRAASHSAIYTSPQPACDALGLADEDGEVAALDVLHEGEPLTPAGGFDNRDCELPDKSLSAPAVVDCNDARSGIWLHEMIGTCDMPKLRPHHSLRAPTPASPGGRAREAHDLAALCDGGSCLRDPVPLRSSSQGTDPSSWVTVDAIAFLPPPPALRLERDHVLEPRSIVPPPLERPPCA